MYQKRRPDDLIEKRKQWLEKSLAAQGLSLVDYDPENRVMPDKSVRAYSQGNHHLSRIQKAGHNALSEYIDLDIVYERDEGICYLCLLPVDTFGWHLDHIVPISRGGSHTYENVAVTHKHCNSNKGSMTADEYWDYLAY